MHKYIYFIILSISIILPFQGELIYHEFIEEFEVDEVQLMLDNEFGNLAPEALYDVSMYKIVYNTIDPAGNEVIASGVIGYPKNLNQAFPIISWQHGTEVRRESVSSNNGFNILSLWLSTRGYIFLEPDYLGLGESELLLSLIVSKILQHGLLLI